MNPDFQARIRAAKAAKSAGFASQVVTINDDWKIVRADENNWEVRHKGKFNGYFGTLTAAFKAIPAKMLDEQAKGSLNQVLEGQKAIVATIETALKFKLSV